MRTGINAGVALQADLAGMPYANFKVEQYEEQIPLQDEMEVIQPEEEQSEEAVRENFVANLMGDLMRFAQYCKDRPDLYLPYRSEIPQANKVLCEAHDSLTLQRQKDYEWRDGYMVRAK